MLSALNKHSAVSRRRESFRSTSEFFSSPFVSLFSSHPCSKGGLSWESRAWNKNKPVEMYRKCQVKICSSVYHNSAAFFRQPKKSFFYTLKHLSETRIQPAEKCWGLHFFIRMTGKKTEQTGCQSCICTPYSVLSRGECSHSKRNCESTDRGSEFQSLCACFPATRFEDEFLCSQEVPHVTGAWG